jgi:hypothetical protein
MAFGRHRRKSDKQPGDSGRYEELTPEQKAKAFDAQVSRSEKRAEKKKAKGEGSYAIDKFLAKNKKKK